MMMMTINHFVNDGVHLKKKKTKKKKKEADVEEEKGYKEDDEKIMKSEIRVKWA